MQNGNSMDAETAARIYERMLNGLQSRIDGHEQAIAELEYVKTWLLDDLNATFPDVVSAMSETHN